MQRNSVTWLAISFSIIAGTCASHLAAKYTDAQTEAASYAVSGLDQSGYESAVALTRSVESYGEGESVPN